MIVVPVNNIITHHTAVLLVAARRRLGFPSLPLLRGYRSAVHCAHFKNTCTMRSSHMRRLILLPLPGKSTSCKLYRITQKISLNHKLCISCYNYFMVKSHIRIFKTKKKIKNMIFYNILGLT